MLRRVHACLALGMWFLAVPAAAQEPEEELPPADRPPAPVAAAPAAEEEPASAPAEEAAEKPAAAAAAPAAATRVGGAGEVATATGDAPPAPPPDGAEEPGQRLKPWKMGVTGYFRAPVAMGISPRSGPDDLDGDPKLQVSYGPNRTVDANYYSFAYTRLQEQDWVELFVTAKRPHVEAAVGWMGYWYQSAGFRSPDAAWAPGLAYVALDTDLTVVPGKANRPNIALTTGAWWPKFGTFDKYDTYTLGRFRQIGEQLRLTIPFSADLEATLVQGFGTNRDGSFNILAPAPYQATVGMDLLHYEHVRLAYKEYFDIGLHYNTEWTRDPNLTPQTVPGKAYSDAVLAHLTTLGGELGLSAPYAGRLWVSPSFIHVRNGWALAEAGTEVMHSLGGEGIAVNYMAWTNNPAASTGSGSMLNLGFLYENTLSGVRGKARGSVTPDLTLNVFGLLANATLDLPAGTVLTQDSIRQFKYGADLTLQAMDWLGVMLRFDEVNYDLDHAGYVFSAITPRVIFSSHFLSGESIYVQYSRYRYGDRMVLAGRWPWGQPMVAGSDIIQGGPYAGAKPDMDVIKLQASVAF